MDTRLARHAEEFGLAIVDPVSFTIERHKHGSSHKICFCSGEKITDKVLKKRIKDLVLPPAWSDVRICVEENGHIQAIGRDEKGRLQYRYHDRWVNVRDAVKTERLLRFGRALPKLRTAIEKDMRRRKRDRKHSAATATRLIDVAIMRPGHEKYAEDGGRGVASLRRKNLRIIGKTAVLRFIGKSNKEHRIEISDKGLVKGLTAMRQGKGQRLFRFLGKKNKQRELNANILNDYMREVSGARISAKDFRTFHGSAEALRFLCEDDKALSADTDSKRRRALSSAMRSVSDKLRNTPTVARSSYVHPKIIDRYAAGELSPDLMKGRCREGLTHEETGLMRFLETAAR